MWTELQTTINIIVTIHLVSEGDVAISLQIENLMDP